MPNRDARAEITLAGVPLRISLIFSEVLPPKIRRMGLFAAACGIGTSSVNTEIGRRAIRLARFFQREP